MNSWWTFSILLASIVVAGTTSRKTLRLYFIAQLCAALAQFLFKDSPLYTYVYVAATLLMLELCCFLLLESKVNRFTIRTAVTFGAFITAGACFRLSGLDSNEWIVLLEGGMFSTLGMAMMLCGKTVPVLGIGTLTLGMSVYDFCWVANDEWKLTNGWAPSMLCALTFFGIAVWNKRHSQQEQRAYLGLR